MESLEFDLVVIGGGAGGLFSSSVASAMDTKTCMIEKDRLGGECTRFGCVPSKALLKSASVARSFARAKEYGIELPEGFAPSTDRVMSHVRDVVKEIESHHPAEVFEDRGIKVLFGSPRFVDRGTVEVDGTAIKGKRFILCTGSSPVIPPIPGLTELDYLDNTTIFDLDELPADLIVLGGGPIGLELGQALTRLGVKVTLVEMAERILIREDIDVSQALNDQLETEGMTLLIGHKATAFRKEGGRAVAVLEDPDGKVVEVSAALVLVAVGRKPNLKGLELEKAGIEVERGQLKVNEYLQTTNENVFACGDVVPPYQFSHVAAYEAMVCVRNALFVNLPLVRQKVNYENIAWATFTEPEIAHLGLTEAEARDRYNDDLQVFTTGYDASDRATTDVETEGFLKIITDSRDNLLGAHIVGAHASELIQGFLIAKSAGLGLSKVSQTLFIYPTLSELVKKTAAKPLLERTNKPWLRYIMGMFKSV